MCCVFTYIADFSWMYRFLKYECCKFLVFKFFRYQWNRNLTLSIKKNLCPCSHLHSLYNLYIEQFCVSLRSWIEVVNNATVWSAHFSDTESLSNSTRSPGHWQFCSLGAAADDVHWIWTTCRICNRFCAFTSSICYQTKQQTNRRTWSSLLYMLSFHVGLYCRFDNTSTSSATI